MIMPGFGFLRDLFAVPFLVRTLRDCLIPHLPLGLTLQIPTERTRAPQKSVSRAVMSH